MERTRPVSDNSLVNLPRASRQYWQGYFQALYDAAMAFKVVGDMETYGILIEQASQTVTEKLETHHGQHGKTSV